MSGSLPPTAIPDRTKERRESLRVSMFSQPMACAAMCRYPHGTMLHLSEEMSLPRVFPSTVAARVLEQPLLPCPGCWPWHAPCPEDSGSRVAFQTPFISTQRSYIKRESTLSSCCWHSTKLGSAAKGLRDLIRPKRNQVQLSSKHVAASPGRGLLTCWKQRPCSLTDRQTLSAKTPDAEFMPPPTKGA